MNFKFNEFQIYLQHRKESGKSLFPPLLTARQGASRAGSASRFSRPDMSFLRRHPSLWRVWIDGAEPAAAGKIRLRFGGSHKSRGGGRLAGRGTIFGKYLVRILLRYAGCLKQQAVCRRHHRHR
jgi:hypothetical protein